MKFYRVTQKNQIKIEKNKVKKSHPLIILRMKSWRYIETKLERPNHQNENECDCDCDCSYIFRPPKDGEEASDVQRVFWTEWQLYWICPLQRRRQFSALERSPLVFRQYCWRYTLLFFSQAFFLMLKQTTSNTICLAEKLNSAGITCTMTLSNFLKK